MKKELPVGMSQQVNGKNGYRLNRTVRGKQYNFGSFQNFDHALRTNGYVDIIVKDLEEAYEKEGVLSIVEIHKLIVENSLSDMQEITRLINDLDSMNNYRIGMISNDIARLHERLDELDQGVCVVELEKKSFWQRITGR